MAKSGFPALLIAVVTLIIAAVHSSDHIAIRFPESLSTENYVALTPNMTTTQTGLTICGWLKKSREEVGSYAVTGAGAWFNYGVMRQTSAHSSEILLMDSMREVRFKRT